MNPNPSEAITVADIPAAAFPPPQPSLQAGAPADLRCQLDLMFAEREAMRREVIFCQNAASYLVNVQHDQKGYFLQAVKPFLAARGARVMVKEMNGRSTPFVLTVNGCQTLLSYLLDCIEQKSLALHLLERRMAFKRRLLTN